MKANTTGVVLVHGAWMDGSSWNKVITLLAKAGIKSVAAALPMTSFADDVKAVNSAIARLDTPAILVGHAYGGAVIGAVNNEHVQALVYIAGLAPEATETVAQIFTRIEPDPRAPKLQPDAYGMMYLPEAAFPAAFAQQATAEEQTTLAATQRPIAPPCIMVPVEHTAWKNKPSWYLVAEQDRMIVAENQRFMAERMGAKVISCPADHVPQITAADTVVGVILEAVGGMVE